MLIGILQAGQAPEAMRARLGDYPEIYAALLAGRGLEFRTYHVEAMEFPRSVHDCDGWLISGSRHGAYEDHPFIPPLEEFIRRAMAEDVPLVGVCFGHQIIAQALGGKVERHPNGWAAGAQEYDFGGRTLKLNAWHRDQVVEAPKEATRVGTNDFCENAALVYGDRAFTLQAHPEFTDAFIEGLLTHRAPGLVPPEVIKAAAERLGRPNDSAVIAGRIADFFLQHQQTAPTTRAGQTKAEA